MKTSSLRSAIHGKLAAYFSIIGLSCTLFSLFYLKWINLQHDVGREIYQAFALAQGRELYTEVIHYFGPLAPLTNSLILRLFGDSLFVFSTIGLVIVILCGLLILELSSTLLPSRLSLLVALLFVSTAAINRDGGSLFMPYSYSQAYGLLLTFSSLWLLIIGVRSERKALWVLFILSDSLLLFTKQEYVMVSACLLGLFLLAVRLAARQRFAVLLLLAAGYATASVVAQSLLFKNYSVWDLWARSTSMFQNHNSGIFHNFLMLYSPVTFLIALHGFSFVGFLFGLTSLFENLAKRNRPSRSTLALVTQGTILILCKGDYLLSELLTRAFFLNWATITCLWVLIDRWFRTRSADWPPLMLVVTAVALYNRQQGSMWMMQGLNWVASAWLLVQARERFLAAVPSPHYLLGTVLTVSLAFTPLRLNQGWDAVYLKNTLGERLPVRKEWAAPLQDVIRFLESTPESATVYTGQETAWLNVFVRRFNRVRNQQWWWYMEAEIVDDLRNQPPDYIVITYYGRRAQENLLFGKLTLLPEFVQQHYGLTHEYGDANCIKVQLYSLLNHPVASREGTGAWSAGTQMTNRNRNP